MIPPSEVKELTITDYAEIILKRLWLVVACVVIISGFIAYRSFSTPKTYEATTTIFIRQRPPQRVVDAKQRIAQKTSISRATQILLLESQTLAERVMKSLNLLSDSEFRDARYPERQLLGMISVEEVKGSGKDGEEAIEIKVRGTDPLKITNIANTWVKEAIAEDIERKIGVTEEGKLWLKKQMDQALNKLEEAERELNDFIQRNKIVTIPDVGQKKETLIDTLKISKANLEREIFEASRKFKGKHDKIISLNNRLEAVEKKLEEETNKLYALQEKALEYKLLKRKANSYKSDYEGFRRRLRELDISQELLTPDIQILDEAILPTSPISPNPKKDIAIAIMIGFILGVSLSYFLEYLDSTLKTSEDVEFYAKMPFLGYIPTVRKKVDQKEVPLVCHLKPYSQVAESFRNIRVALLFSAADEKISKTITVTSSIPGEGKSFFSTSLAITWAAAGESTLLIDADMRKGMLNKTFGIETSKGLTSVLAGKCSWEEAVVNTSIPHLSLLPCGTFSPNPTALLDPAILETVFSQMEGKFKRIVIDSPPILSVSDAIILGGKSEGLVFVIRAKRAPFRSILEAKKKLDDKVKVVGAVLNDAEIKRDAYYYYRFRQSHTETEAG